jgi:hypothetical protein
MRRKQREEKELQRSVFPRVSMPSDAHPVDGVSPGKCKVNYLRRRPAQDRKLNRSGDVCQHSLSEIRIKIDPLSPSANGGLSRMEMPRSTQVENAVPGAVPIQY